MVRIYSLCRFLYNLKIDVSLSCHWLHVHISGALLSNAVSRQLVMVGSIYGMARIYESSSLSQKRVIVSLAS